MSRRDTSNKLKDQKVLHISVTHEEDSDKQCMFPHQEIDAGNYGSCKKTSFIYKVKREKKSKPKMSRKGKERK